MLVRLSKIFVVLALAFSIGLHWAFFQAIAWGGMVISYSQYAPLTEAVVKTFDGRHPCELCKNIQKEKRAEKNANYKVEASKIKFHFPRIFYVFTIPPLYWEVGAGGRTGELLNHAPPVPPPRELSC